MQFDLQKELGLSRSQTQRRFPWLYVIAGFCAVNVIVVIGILILVLSGLDGKKDPNYIPNEDIVEATKQMFDNFDLRIATLETAIKEITTSLKSSQKDLTLIDAEQRITKKREKRKTRTMQKSGMTDSDVQDAINDLHSPPPEAARLSAEEQANFDALIDQDDTGNQVRNFITSLDVAKQLSYLRVLRRKGDQWYVAAVQAIKDDDEDKQVFVDNAMYFYSIISDTSRDNATIALTQTKITQLKMVQQNAEIKADAADLSTEQEQKIAALKESLKPRETASQAEQRRLQKRRAVGPINDYNAAEIRKSYESDWDPDPRVREKRGEGSSVRSSDLKRDWNPDPRVRKKEGIID
jgi:hypothetical protein